VHDRVPDRSPWPGLAAAALTGGILLAVQAAAHPPMLLAERFLAGAGWLEAALLALYAGGLATVMVRTRQTAPWRRRLWRLFSALFFGQLLLGLAGVERCLMTGSLHLPVPAVIVGGPLFRGHGFFMPLLLGGAVMVLGPAWCSFLCYIGAWDDAAAATRPGASDLPRWRNLVRAAMLALVAIVALALRRLGVPGTCAALLGGLFGIVGLGVMLSASRRTGAMVHCAAWCPIGLVTTTLGRLNPFRIRVGPKCVRCGRCYHICRYDALGETEVTQGRAGNNCTLCGDCLPSCPHHLICYSFPGLSPEASRTLFLVLAVSLHAVFIALGRL